MQPTDYGPIYRETDLTALIKEPWNMASAALFILIAVYWLFSLKIKPGSRFQYWLNWGLLVGGIGGTLFHGFRAHFIFLALDFIPILVLSVATAFYFWFQILTRRIYVLIPLAALFLARGIFAILGLERSMQINASYATLGLFIILPAVLVLHKIRSGSVWIVTSVFFFSLALFCRVNDWAPYFADLHGGHWLWHVFGALGVVMLQVFIHRYSREKIAKF